MGQQISHSSNGRGQRTPGYGAHDIQQHPSRQTNPFLLMDFATLWIGKMDRFEVSRLPSSWDELMDWCDDAEHISSSFESRENSSNQQIERIEALVYASEKHRVNYVPSWTPMEQAQFFAESVSYYREWRPHAIILVSYMTNSSGGYSYACR